MWAQLLRQRDMQTIGQEGDEDVRFDSMLELVVERTHGQIALEVFECLFDLYELDVIAPQLGGVSAGEIGA